MLARVLRVRGSKRSLFADAWCPDSGGPIQLHVDLGAHPVRLRRGDLLDVAGVHGQSKAGEPTFFVERLEIVRPAVEHASRKPETPAGGVLGVADIGLLARVRDVMRERGYHEVPSATWLDRYNGGSSTPMRVNWKDRAAGYLRVTFEERMLAALAETLMPVYQVGPVYKGGRELTLLEAYRPAETLERARAECEAVLAAAVGRPVLVDRCDLDDALASAFGLEEAARIWNAIATGDGDLLGRVGIAAPAACSASRAAVAAAAWVAAQRSGWVEISGFPPQCSPLYRTGMGPFGPRLLQAKVLRDGEMVADLGVQETDPVTLRSQLDEHRQALGTRGAVPADVLTPRELADVADLGIPNAIGFSVRLASARG